MLRTLSSHSILNFSSLLYHIPFIISSLTMPSLTYSSPITYSSLAFILSSRTHHSHLIISSFSNGLFITPFTLSSFIPNFSHHKWSLSSSENVKKLNFVAAILDFWQPSWIDNEEFLTLYSIHDNDHLYQFW